MRLAGKTALITGAGAGIGRETALPFAREGARIVVAEWDGVAGEATAIAIRDGGGEAVAVPTDVTEQAQVQAAVDTDLRQFGRLDILYNNVGGSIVNASSMCALMGTPGKDAYGGEGRRRRADALQGGGVRAATSAWVWAASSATAWTLC